MSDKKKKNNIGFYTAFCCCIAAIGIVGFVNANRTLKRQESMNEPIIETETLPPIITVEEDNAPVNAQKIIEIVETPSPKPEIKATVAPTVEPEIIESGENEDFYDGPTVESVSIKEQPRFMFPADGIITQEFSGDNLIYSKKMGDYRTHNGIDITASADSDVVSAYDGVVEDCYEDVIGKTVLINHENGFKTRYSNLDDISNIQKGMKIKKGDFLAHVGASPDEEKPEESFIHFELIKNDIYVNPEDYFE